MTEIESLEDLSVIIPAYNEELRIAETIEKIIEFLSKNIKKFEIIVVDDGSFDHTVSVVENLTKKYFNLKLIKNEVNKGKGFSIKHGVSVSKGKYCLFTDADSSSPIENINAFLPYISEDTIIIGSRGLSQSKIEIHQPIFREYMGKCFNLLVRIFIFGGIRDTQCGFKMFSRNIANKVFPLLTVDGFAFDVELLFLGRKLGFKIVELPIIWRNDIRSTVRPFKDSARMFMEILKIRKRLKDLKI